MEKPVQEKQDSLLLFLQSLRESIDITALRKGYRATYKGLFVADDSVAEIVRLYQTWLEKQSGGEIHKSEEKSRKRLFNSTNPESFYLMEGKNVLSGAVVPLELKEPQRLGIPYYLGALVSKQNYLHAGDPMFSGLKDVEVRTEGTAVSLRIKLGNDYCSVKGETLESFRILAGSSSKTLREFPEINDSLGALCRAFSVLLRRSKPLSEKSSLLVPYRYSKKKAFSFRLLGKMVIVLNPTLEIVDFYGLWGRHLYSLLRRELARIPEKRIGSFEIFPERQKFLGRYKYSSGNMQVSPHALIQFYEALEHSRDPKDALGPLYTARDLFVRFSELFQLAQPIKRQLIATHLKDYSKSAKEFRIYGLWIFVISAANSLDAVINKIDSRH